MCRTITVSNERYTITFVKHLEVRFALKETKEKQLVVFWKIYPKVSFINVEEEKSLKWNLTSKPKILRDYIEAFFNVINWGQVQTEYDVNK